MVAVVVAGAFVGGVVVMRTAREQHITSRGRWRVYEVRWIELDSALRVTPSVAVAASGPAGAVVVCRVSDADTIEGADKRLRAYLSQAAAYGIDLPAFTTLQPR